MGISGTSPIICNCLREGKQFGGDGTNIQVVAVIQNARLFAITKPPIAVYPFLSINDRLIDERKDRMARHKARAIEEMAGIKRTALYGKLNQLVRSGQIRKDGNVYYVSNEE